MLPNLKFWHTLIIIALYSAVITLATLLGVTVIPWWWGLIIGGIIFVTGIPFYALNLKKVRSYTKKTAFNLVIMAVNGVAIGFSVSTFYTVKGVELGLIEYLLGFSYSPVVYLAFTVLTLINPKKKKRLFTVLTYVIWSVLCITGSWLIFGLVGNAHFLTPMTFIAALLLSLMAMLGTEDFTSLTESMAAVSYFAVAIVAIIVLLSLAGDGCDGCDGCDCCDGLVDGGTGGYTGKSKKIKKEELSLL